MDSFVHGFIVGLTEMFSFIELQKREAQIPMPKRPVGLTDIERTLIRMMTEAHVHILDSGFYGRNWEKRRKMWNVIHPNKTPKAWLVIFSDGDFYPVIDTYHYLKDNFVRDRKLDIDFHKFANSPKWKKEPWEDVIDAWIEEKGFEIVDSFNTYMDEYDLLDQVIQYYVININPDYDVEEWYYEYGGEESPIRLIIQTHNGADIRGGYSEPHVFMIGDDWNEIIRTLGDYREEATISILSPKTKRCVGTIWWSPDGVEVQIMENAPISLKRLEDEIQDLNHAYVDLRKGFIVKKDGKPFLKVGRVYYPLEVYPVWI